MAKEDDGSVTSIEPIWSILRLLLENQLAAALKGSLQVELVASSKKEETCADRSDQNYP